MNHNFLSENYLTNLFFDEKNVDAIVGKIGRA